MGSSVLLFLDIDGVCNSARFIESLPPFRGEVPPSTSPEWTRYYYDRRIDLDCLARVSRICQETGAKVVISSSWRDGKGCHEIKEQFARLGAPFTIIGETPDLTRESERGSGVLYAASRWDEIRAYLVGCGEKLERYAILDDDCLFPENNPELARHASRHVRTDFRVGLTDADAEKVIRLLGEPGEEGRA